MQQPVWLVILLYLSKLSYGGLNFWHMFLRVKKGVELGARAFSSQLWEFTYEYKIILIILPLTVSHIPKQIYVIPTIPTAYKTIF